MIIQEVKDAIRAKDVELVKEKLIELEKAIHSDTSVMIDFLQPATITELHKLLREVLEVNPRRLQIRKRVSMPKPRAILFLKSLQAGVNSL